MLSPRSLHSGSVSPAVAILAACLLLVVGPVVTAAAVVTGLSVLAWATRRLGGALTGDLLGAGIDRERTLCIAAIELDRVATIVRLHQTIGLDLEAITKRLAQWPGEDVAHQQTDEK